MRKKYFIAASLLAVMGIVSFATILTNNSGHTFSSFELANIEALSKGEGTPVGHCFLSGVGASGDPSWEIPCDDRTTDDMIYPCENQTVLNFYTVRTMCTK